MEELSVFWLLRECVGVWGMRSEIARRPGGKVDLSDLNPERLDGWEEWPRTITCSAEFRFHTDPDSESAHRMVPANCQLL